MGVFIYDFYFVYSMSFLLTCGREITEHQDTHYKGYCPICVQEQRYRDRGKTPPTKSEENNEEYRKIDLKGLIGLLVFSWVMGIGLTIGIDTFSNAFLGGNIYIDIVSGMIIGVVLFAFFYFYLVAP